MAVGRERILAAAMRLFGERGYAATSTAAIEAEAGLSPGAGGLFAHFPKKSAVLRAGLEAIFDTSDDVLPPPAPASTGPEEARPRRQANRTALTDIAYMGLRRLEHDRDFNRILVRDLRAEPDLLELAAQREIRPVHARLAAYLAEQGDLTSKESFALAAVLIGATSHLWLLNDIYGTHPAGVSTDDYVTMLARCAAAVLNDPQTPSEKPTARKAHPQ